MMGVEQVMVRRLKSEVLDLPEKQYVPIKVDLTPQQRALYRDALEDLKITLPGNPNPMELENALTKFLRLKEICGSTFKFTGEDHSSKLDRAEEIAQEVVDSGEHFVIFSQFLHIQDLIQQRLEARGIRCFKLNGTTHPKAADRVPYVHRWEASEPAVLVAGLQVAGIGLNMTKANKCLFLDKLFVPKLNEQAEDRLHRIGADDTQPVQIYSLLCRNTVELRVEAIVRRKVKLFDSLIENNQWKKAIYDAIKEADADLDAAA
jgi:SNF2 family DNA or RNA helicase